MAILTIDLRSGRTDEQKRAFAAAVLEVVSAATDEPRENVLLIPRIDDIGDLAKHEIITTAHMGMESWSFPPSDDASQIPRTVSFTPRLVVNNVHAAIASVVEGRGVARMLSYHVAPQLAEDALRIVLAHAEPRPIPVHLVSPHGRLAVPKVRAFVDFALPRLRAAFARLRP